MTSDRQTTLDPHPHRRVWRIAAPAIIANISGPMVGVVDTWALGHLPDPHYLAGIAVGAFVFHFVYWSFGFLRMGTTGLVAQAAGAGEESAVLRIVLRSAVLGVAFAAGALLLQRPILTGLFAALDPNEAEAALAMRYCLIRVWGTPAILLRITVIGFLVGTQRVRTALAVELLLNLANAGLTVLLVTILGFGIEGAAVASVAAELLAAALALGVAIRLLDLRALTAAIADRAFWRLHAFARLLAVNGYLFVRTLFLAAAFALLWRTSAGLGTLTLSANQVLIQFLMIASFGLDGLAYAAEALVGEAKGRRSRAYLRQMVATTTMWAVILAAFYAVAYGAAGAAIVAAFTDLAAVRAEAQAHLPWLVAMPVVAVWSYQFDGIFIGATETAAMLWTMIAAFILYVALLAGLVPNYGNDGLWGAMMGFLAARGLGLALFYPGLARRVGRAETNRWSSGRSTPSG